MKKLAKLFGQKDEPAPKSAPVEEKVSRVEDQGATKMEYGLEFITESGETRVFTKLPIAIGRGEANDLILTDESVSARHALVDYDARIGGVCIEDVGALNGLFLDEHPTRKNVLQDGSKIRLGSVTLSFRDTGYIHPGA
ncbi:MAG: FHA domain-containing protein [Chloroflexota bacterium]